MESENGNIVNWMKKHFHTLYRALFLDVLFNRKTRPIFIYAVIIIGIGAALYHWLEGGTGWTRFIL
jgi:hypothetical protein